MYDTITFAGSTIIMLYHKFTFNLPLCMGIVIQSTDLKPWWIQNFPDAGHQPQRWRCQLII